MESPIEHAESAARAFLGGAPALEPLGEGQSVSYRVRADGASFLLRLHGRTAGCESEDFLTPAALESEALWLSALNGETELVVPRPVPLGPGCHVLELAPTDEGPAIPCTLLHWVQGDHLTTRPGADQARRLGKLLGTLQRHAAHWSPPPDFVRPRQDTGWWWRSLGRAAPLEDAGLATAADLGRLRRVVGLAEAELGRFEGRPECNGLIHGDLHLGNVVFLGDDPRPIDFGRCCLGPWLYDVAEAMGSLPAKERRAFLDGYAELRPLEDADLRRIEGYFCASLVEVFGNKTADPRERDYLRAAIPAWAPHLEGYLSGRSFLLEL